VLPAQGYFPTKSEADIDYMTLLTITGRNPHAV